MTDQEKSEINYWILALGAIVILFAAILIGRGVENSGGSSGSGSEVCSLGEYKEEAVPVMQEFQNYIQGIDLGDPGPDVKQELREILDKAEGVGCAYKYPLKQETLEYSIRHMLDVVRYAEQEDFSEMQDALNKVEINVNQFYNWEADVN